MPQFNRRELDVKASENGFNRDTFEKVLRLKMILDFMNSQEYMREHLLLKAHEAYRSRSGLHGKLHSKEI